MQSWVEFDATEEDTRGLGQVTRRKRDETDDEKPKKRLSGAAARTLYLECLQIMLWKQVAWMIQEKNHPSDMETVVRDLWDLRLRGCPREGEEVSKRDITFHSSQDGFSAMGENGRFTGRGESWDPSLGSEWPTPSVVDTLVLCYFACLLLRIPTTLGDIRNWADKGRMPYRKAVLVPSPRLLSFILTLGIALRLSPGRSLQASAASIHDPNEARAGGAGLYRPAFQSLEYGVCIQV